MTTVTIIASLKSHNHAKNTMRTHHTAPTYRAKSSIQEPPKEASRVWTPNILSLQTTRQRGFEIAQNTIVGSHTHEVFVYHHTACTIFEKKRDQCITINKVQQ
ncbi:unnamed protein product [Ectocarpus sp. 4 AP-2014]